MLTVNTVSPSPLLSAWNFTKEGIKMKREYFKPYLAVESFQLNAAIAGACSGLITLNHKIDACTLDDETNDPMSPIFGAPCDLNVVQSDNPDGVCVQAFQMTDQFLTS